MKKIFVTLIAAVIALSTVAQNNNASRQNKGKNKGKEVGRQNGDDMETKRTGPVPVRRQGMIGGLSSINLTEAQKQQLQQLNDTYKTQLHDLNKNENLTGKEKKERRAAITQQHRTNVLNLLTPEQRIELEEDRKEYKQKGKDHKKGHGDDMMQRGDDRFGREDYRSDLRQLNLTDEQGVRIKAVNEEFRTKVQAIQKNIALTNDQKKAQREAAQQQHTAGIKAILTQEQKDKLEALKQTRPDRSTKK